MTTIIDHGKDCHCPHCNGFGGAQAGELVMNPGQKLSPAMQLIAFLLLLALVVWALSLAGKVPKGPSRTMHTFFALAASPLYIISTYIAQR